MRKFSEPVVVEAQALYVLPSPEPVLVPDGRVGDLGTAYLIGSTDGEVTADDTPYPTGGIRYSASFYGTYFNRVYAIPFALFLTDPPDGEANYFYLWNTSFNTVSLASVDEVNTDGLTLDFDVGLTLETMVLTRVSLAVGLQAGDGQESEYQFNWTTGLHTPLNVSILRTNLLAVVPENPVAQTFKYKTDIITARDGTEQRVSLLQFARQTVNYKMIMSDLDEENKIYKQMFAKGGQQMTFPLWYTPMRVSESVEANVSQLSVDLTKYDVQPNDQLFMYNNDDGFEIVRVLTVNTYTNVITLYKTLVNPFTTEMRFYRIATGYLPGRPSVKYGAWNSVTAEFTLALTEYRALFSGDAVAVEVGVETYLRDRILTSRVDTLFSAPIMRARPIINGEVDDTFDWAYDVIDFETGAVQQTSARQNASVDYQRTFHIKYLYQEFFYAFVLNWMHGRRQPVWLPTWQNDLGPSVLSMNGNSVILTGTTYPDDFATDSSHRGLWIKTSKGWLARKVVSAFKTLDGTTSLTVSPNLPQDEIVGPFFVSHLVLARLGSDEVQYQRQSAYTFADMTFTSTLSTSTGA